jgi:hypothetical protein
MDTYKKINSFHPSKAKIVTKREENNEINKN